MYMKRESPNNSSNANDKPFPRWQGMNVKEFEGTIDEVSTRIPSFATLPFSFNEGSACSVNSRLKLVVRDPAIPGEAPLPVRVVSKNYRLVQHRAVFSTALNALTKVGIRLEQVRAYLRLTEQGEMGSQTGSTHLLHFPYRSGLPVSSWLRKRPSF